LTYEAALDQKDKKTMDSKKALCYQMFCARRGNCTYCEICRGSSKCHSDTDRVSCGIYMRTANYVAQLEWHVLAQGRTAANQWLHLEWRVVAHTKSIQLNCGPRSLLATTDCHPFVPG